MRISYKFSIFYFIFAIKLARFFFSEKLLDSIQVLLCEIIQPLLLLLLLYARIWLILKGHHQVQLLTTVGSQTVYIYAYSYFHSFWPAHWVGSFVQLSCTCHRNQRVGGKSRFKTLCTGSNVGLVLRGCSNLFWFQLSPRICFSAEASWSSVAVSPSLQSAPLGFGRGPSRLLCLRDPSDRNAC